MLCEHCGKNEVWESLYQKTGLKYCNTCYNFLAQFGDSKYKSEIYNAWNKDKLKQYRKEYYQKNKERLKEYYKNNKEKIAENQKRSYQKNKEKRLAYAKEYQNKNREKLNSYRKEYYKNKRREAKDTIASLKAEIEMLKKIIETK